MEPRKSPREVPNPSRKKYKQPKLTVYGSIGELTTGGSGHAMEGSKGKSPRP
jgi:hypothetical protein